MLDTEQRIAAKTFADEWKNKGYEKGESQSFWLSLLHDVLGVEHPEKFITFEEQVHLDHTSFIDGYIPETKILIEQKGLNKDLNRPIKQSDGTLLNPFQQAKRYITELPLSQHPRWVVTCNFAEFYIYDMERPGGEPEKIKLADLEKEYYRLSFLTDTGNVHLHREMEVSMQAGKIVGLLYDALQKQYSDPTTEKTMKDLNVLCVRLVFCLYAEDAGVFGRREMFHDYMSEYNIHQMRKALIELFRVLDQKPEERDPYLKDDSPRLAEFPYVNGGLFSDESIEIPPFTDEIKDLLLVRASENFDWSEISPTIFGAVFESTLNPETRRKGGMHYTSVENIHKVIDPLFLDNLKKELAGIENISVIKNREQKLHDFQDKLASLKFLDPACGSGNFLTETYLSLRRLENQVLSDLNLADKSRGTMFFSFVNPIKVSIDQFYGIEINDFAVTVAKTALWIAESQTMKETENIVSIHIDFLPLKTNAYIHEGNALQLNWEQIIPKNELNYIMGNPPFVGARLMTSNQKSDIAEIFKDWKNSGNLDYVACWYKKAAEFMQSTSILAALVSTNSVTQGEVVPILWKPLFYDYHIHINFAHRTFIWDSEANEKAHVHCVIVGFSCIEKNENTIYDNGTITKVPHINAYLYNAPDIFADNRKKPICNVSEMYFGNMPNDGGFLSDYSDEQKEAIIKQYPAAKPLFKKFLGATEFLHNKSRWCLWLYGVSPSEYKDIPPIIDAIRNVYKMRSTSSRASTRKLANTPALFGEIRQPDKDYLIIPRHSSQNRSYIPIGYENSDVICGDANLMVPAASLYSFGVLESAVHMAWVQVVCGRIKSDYRYSATVVYNNFPWPIPTDSQKQKIEQTAQAILDARALYPECSLADLYGENMYIYPELLKAHQRNDIAVLAAYGITNKNEEFKNKSAFLVNVLMKRYEEIIANK